MKSFYCCQKYDNCVICPKDSAIIYINRRLFFPSSEVYAAEEDCIIIVSVIMQRMIYLRPAP